MDEPIKTVEGDLDARGLRFGIVASRFNDFIVDRLLSGALEALIKHGANPDDIEVVRVPGAFEIPLALQKLATSRRHDALIALDPEPIGEPAQKRVARVEGTGFCCGQYARVRERRKGGA